MTGFWRGWLTIWCAAVGGFGIVLTAGAFAATDAPVRVLLDTMNGSAPLAMTDPLRFALALMGAVTSGWAATLYAAIRAADLLGDRGQPIWRLLTAGVIGWYIIDSALSVATGFGLNAVSNTIFLVAFLWPVLASGVLGVSSSRGAFPAR